MFKERIQICIAVDLDMFPGQFHTRESAEESIQSVLLNSIPHYNPVVLTESIPDKG